MQSVGQAMRVRKDRPDSLLHALDGFTERWLFDPALLRGAREVQFVTNRTEVADVLRFHDQHSKTFGVERIPRKRKAETVIKMQSSIQIVNLARSRLSCK